MNSICSAGEKASFLSNSKNGINRNIRPYQALAGGAMTDISPKISIWQCLFFVAKKADNESIRKTTSANIIMFPNVFSEVIPSFFAVRTEIACALMLAITCAFEFVINRLVLEIIILIFDGADSL